MKQWDSGIDLEIKPIDGALAYWKCKTCGLKKMFRWNSHVSLSCPLCHSRMYMIVIDVGRN